MDYGRGASCEESQVPSTLHGQLFLLAFDSEQGRFFRHDSTLFGLALRGAMLTDLFLRGFLVERGGRPVPGRAASPEDLLLRAAFAQVGVHNQATWAQLIVGGAHDVASVVREQLVAEGWLRAGRHAVAAIPGASLEPYDACRVGALADDVGCAIRNAIAGLSAEPWLLACGLLAVLAELPSVADIAATVEWHALEELVDTAVGPVCGLAEAIRLQGAS